jgi:hypothetical protein
LFLTENEFVLYLPVDDLLRRDFTIKIPTHE